MRQEQEAKGRRQEVGGRISDNWSLKETPLRTPLDRGEIGGMCVNTLLDFGGCVLFTDPC